MQENPPADKSPPIAHAAKDANDAWRDPHDLAEHLRAVARFSLAFSGAEWPPIKSKIGKDIRASICMQLHYAFLFFRLS